MPMYFVEKSGLSTADESIAKRHAEAGYAIQIEEVSVTTLSSLWATYVPAGQDVHFLKIDVEGFERAVLAGNDWQRYRPWIAVVEATLPNSQTESHTEWEEILFRAQYIFVYADGLNRFYVASERSSLAAAFKYPPNVFDDFVPAQLQRSTESETAMHRLMTESAQRIAISEQSLTTLREQEKATRTLAHSEQESLRSELGLLRQQLSSAQQQHAALLLSASWRLTSPLRKLLRVVPRPLWVQARRIAKLAWWIVTPWRIPQRLRFIRYRDRSSAGRQKLNLFSDRALQRAADAPFDVVLWTPHDASSVVDMASAARWCIDLLRSKKSLRARFPNALSGKGQDSFQAWLQGDEGEHLGLSSSAQQLVQEVFEQDFSARARQYLMFRTDARSAWPHGLTPAGQHDLFRWFTTEGRKDGKLSAEEVLWLFIEAAENPALELIRAYLFTPSWQEAHPDGLTVFGRNDFAGWFSRTYGVSAQWTDPTHWDVDIEASRQLRQAYFARSQWQAAHPDALKNEDAAAAWLTWLQTPEANLSTDEHIWCQRLDQARMAAQLVAGGVNMIGHFCFPCGIRVSAEALVDGLRQTGIATSLRDVRTDVKDEPHHVRFDGLEDFDVTIVHTQPEPFFNEAYSRADLAPRRPRTYRIAYWYWEFDSVPEAWMPHAAQVDEVWAATEFVAKGLRDRLSVPVKTLFPGVRLDKYERRNRQHFGLDEGKYTFLFNFHMSSIMERKNPLGLIAAFKAAFRQDEAVELIIKTMFGHQQPEQLQQLNDAAADANITVIDESYSSDETLSLMDACDAYVSLHRSEGLGLTMAEAMLMGKPVIATAYSGNLDFMDDTNSLLVPFELVKVGRPLPPYDSELLWAEPSVDHAARMMRQIFDNQSWARELGARAKSSAEARLSLATAGLAVAERLAEIRAARQSSRSV